MAVPHDTGGLTWSLEPSHFPAAPTRWTAQLFVTIQTEVLRRVTAEAGLPVDGLAMREFDGRVVHRRRAARRQGTKASASGPRAAALQGRARAASPGRGEQAMGARGPPGSDHRGVVRRQRGGAARRGAHVLPPRSRDHSGVKLAEAIDRAIAYAEDALFWHFYLHGAAVWQIGRLGMQLEAEHGWSDAEFAALFTGLSTTSTGPAARSERCSP